LVIFGYSNIPGAKVGEGRDGQGRGQELTGREEAGTRIQWQL